MNEQLIEAAKSGDVELVKRLLDDGADKNYQDGVVSQYLYSLSCLSMFNKWWYINLLSYADCRLIDCRLIVNDDNNDDDDDDDNDYDTGDAYVCLHCV